VRKELPGFYVRRKRELELALNTIPPHPRPRVELEQYATPSTLASTLLWIAEFHFGDISGKKVLDLGSGTGRLGIGAILLGASVATLLDIDPDSLEVAKKWSQDAGVYAFLDLVAADVNELPFRENFSFETVIQNPPFGVHRKGSDVAFLRSALLCARVVYSIHKETSLEYILSVVRRWGAQATVLHRDRICLPPMFEWHRNRVHCFRVAVIRIERST